MVMDTAPGEEFPDEGPRIQLDASEEAAPSTHEEALGVNGASAVNFSGEVAANGGSAAAVLEGSHFPPTGFQTQAGYIAPASSSYQPDALGQPLGYNQSGAFSGQQQSHPPQTSYDAYGQAYGASQYGAQPSGGIDVWRPDAPPGGGTAAQPIDLLTAKLMEEEAKKMRRGGARGGAGGPQVVEVSSDRVAEDLGSIAVFCRCSIAWAPFSHAFLWERLLSYGF